MMTGMKNYLLILSILGLTMTTSFAAEAQTPQKEKGKRVSPPDS
jgi:hypothetical protein